MERSVLGDGCLNYAITIVTDIPFLSRYTLIVCNNLPETERELLTVHSKYYSGLSLLYYPCSLYKPSIMALSCVSLALYTLNHDPWPDCLKVDSQEEWTSTPLRECIQKLQKFIKSPPYPNLNATKENYEKIHTLFEVPDVLIHTRYP